MNRRIYFDHSATTPVDPRVAAEMQRCLVDRFGNPSSIHQFGREAKSALENARTPVAKLLHCPPDDVYFTSGGTEADNIALLGYCLANLHRGDHVVTTNIEHPAVKFSAAELENLGFSVTRVATDKYGEVHVDDVEHAITDRTVLVSVMHINNEVGTINDIAAIGRLCHKRKIAFHSDAVQSFGKVPINVDEMRLDMVSLSGHKIYGPKGIGALFVRNGLKIHPRIFGGHQEGELRPGTENLPGIVGLGMAANICAQEMQAEAGKLLHLRETLWELITTQLEDVTLNGHPDKRLPGNLNLTFHGVEGEALLMALDLEGIAVSSGSACSSGSTAPSPVLTALGLSPLEAQSSMRITLGRGNTEADIQTAAEIIVSTVRKLRVMAQFETPASAAG